MRFAILIACLSLFTVGVIAQYGPIPKQFRGSWAGNRAQCGKDSESSLTVYGNRVRFYESRGYVQWVKKISDVEIEVELALSGEGQEWRSTRRFRLSDNGRTLTILTTQPPHGEYARARCDE
jgi:hypothetical protein